MIFEKQIVNLYKGMIYTRCDDTDTVFYYSAEDFPGLRKERYSFEALAGHTLNGYLYCYENPKPGRLVVFDHGFGGGHRAYMKEIEMLAKNGYLVLAYDHTGCMESGGENPNGFGQSLCDLNDCICAVKKDERFKGFDISVMGHSWGAFSTMNIAALHPDISHAVAMCGFVSVEEAVNAFFGGILKGYRKAVYALETASNPNFVGYHAAETLSNTEAKTLLIYSEDDPLCKKRHYDILREALGDKAHVRFLLVSNKGHNPNYTEDAVKYLGEFSAARAKLARKKNISTEEKRRFAASFDWERMTVQDEAVWKEILLHLES